ncbi:hypothetical protein MMC24_006344 [Lignoscripta atroalba]|nr:hypothetical protein [Lignoscripta atroalba]
MANPLLSYSTPKIIENGQRALPSSASIARLCQRLEPNFDLSRLIIKVPSTWEGLQACRKLKSLGIKTLATTLFTMEQAILAAEVGCVSISPFVHELKIHFDPTYHDTDPIFDLCVKAQQYYEQHSYATRVKACSLISVDEIMQLAGVSALTLTPTLLQALSDAHEPEAKVLDRSLFNKTPNVEERPVQRASFVNDESKFRTAFARSEGGKGQVKTKQAIDIFCDYQKMAEAMMRDTDLTSIG